jgi:ATP-dependent exoDNAse (exonuclease V) beta subunit
MTDLYDFKNDTVLRASAGTGKTEALTGQYLRLITGATNFGKPIHPRRIVAVTFTEKAAAEMRHRIYRALRDIELDVPTEKSLFSVRQLREALRIKNIQITPEDASSWIDALATARIMTIHAFCLSLLQSHATAIGIDPQFEVLNEERATVLLEQCITQILLQRLEKTDELLDTLLNELGGFQPLVGQGLVTTIARLYQSVREFESDFSSLATQGLFNAKRYSALLNTATQTLDMHTTDDLSAAWKRLLHAHQAILTDKIKGAQKAVLHRVQECIETLAAAYPHGPPTLPDLFSASASLAAAFQTSQLVNSEPAASVREAIATLWILPQTSARAALFIDILKALHAKYTDLKQTQGVLDYQDLTLGARNLLKHHPDIRQHIHKSIDVLLVDEFQDTNAAQRDIVQMVTGNFDHSSDSLNTFGDQASRLFVVGDRKQSIYGFRGADVTVFEDFVNAMEQRGAQSSALQTSYRSSPDLLTALNLLSEAVLKPSSQERSDIQFDNSDTLIPPESPSLALTQPFSPVELLGDPQSTANPNTEADWIAARAAELATSESMPCIRENGSLRAPRFADMALLLPRFTHVQTYLSALQKFGVPFVVVRSKGLMAGAEARDIVSMCKVLLNNYSSLDLLAVLRSPLCTLSDPTLARLASSLVPSDDLVGSLYFLRVKHLDSEEETRFNHCRTVLARLQGNVETLGLGRALSLLLSQCQYGAVLAGLPSAHQRLTNLDRLVHEIESREQLGENPHAILQDLKRPQQLGTNDYESSAALEGADVLSVMTVHQAKGLEFPIVFAADLGRKLPAVASAAIYDPAPDAGLSVVVHANQKAHHDIHSKKINEQLRHRHAAEQKRLFYVQITRARDRLILSGKNLGIMKTLMDTAVPKLLESGLMVRVLPELTPKTNASMSTLTAEQPSAVFPQRNSPSATPQPSRCIDISVTALQDFALCPRRYRAAHVLRLPQHPYLEPSNSSQLDSVDPRERGTWFHVVLERIDFASAAQSPEKEAHQAIHTLPQTLQEDLHPKLLTFLKSDYIKEVSTATSLHREVPFVLHVTTPSVHTNIHGQIDLFWKNKETWDLIDYKATRPKDNTTPLAPYTFQLDVYALALHQHTAGSEAIMRGIQFLDGKTRMPIFIEESFDAANVKSNLEHLSSQMHTAQHTGKYAGKPIEYCDSIACGYRWLCHPKT